MEQENERAVMSATSLDDFKPSDLGFDHERFPSYRQIQLEAIEQATSGEERFQALTIPTGGGKSLVAASIHKLTGWRTVILTSTLGLQSQYMRDFEHIGLTDIRGKANYKCQDFEDMTCRDGGRAGCQWAGSVSCAYESAKGRARNREFLISNYPFWLNVNDRAQGLERSISESIAKGGNPIECLVLDEADNAPEVLSDYMSIRVTAKELVDLLGWDDPEELKDDLSLWVKAANSWFREADIQLDNMERQIKAKERSVSKAELDFMHKLESLWDKLDRIKSINPDDDDWVLEMKKHPQWGNSWEFGVVSPGRYAESKLFVHIPHVVLMSGTLRPEDLGELWIRKEERKFREWPKIFPPNRNPIYLIPAKKIVDDKPVSIRLNKHTSDQDKRIWLEWMDLFLDARQDRKGAMLVTSYDYQQFIMENSRHAKWMLGNTKDPESDSATKVFDDFVKAKPPKILISPSFGRGWDMKYDIAEYVIIPKIPFKPIQSKVMQARLKRWELYGDYLAMKDIRQMVGRPMREFDDRAEIAIMDGQGEWWLWRNKGLAARGFVDGIRKRVDLPKPPPKLEPKLEPKIVEINS